MLNIAPEEAALLTFAYGAADGSVVIKRRCDGFAIHGVTQNGPCKDTKEVGVDPAKYARICEAPLNDFVGVSVNGTLLCATQGKIDNGTGPIAVKGPCAGSFDTSTMEFCKIDGSVGKRFFPKGPCVN